MPNREIWEPIPGWPYEVSDSGRVRRSQPGRNTFPGRVLKPKTDKDGYLVVGLRNRGPQWNVAVSRLVALGFHGSPPTDEHEAAHADGDKNHNVPGNIYWATPAENCADNVAHGTQVHGEDQHLAKLTATKVVAMRRQRRATGASYSVLGAEYGVTARTAWLACTGQTWARVEEPPVPLLDARAPAAV